MRRHQILLSSLLQRPLLDPFPPDQDGWSPARVDVGGGLETDNTTASSALPVWCEKTAESE